jgi:hypothetical protein
VYFTGVHFPTLPVQTFEMYMKSLARNAEGKVALKKVGFSGREILK